VASPQLFSILGIDERSAARAHHLVALGHDAADRFTLVGAEGRFSLFAKDVGDAAPSHVFDETVGVHEREAQAARDVAPEGGLAATAEADANPLIHQPRHT